MARARTIAKIGGGALAAGLILFTHGVMDADAARRGSKRSRAPLEVQTINVGFETGVAANEVLEAVFTTAVKPKSINEAVFQVREENATGTGYTKQIFGDYQIAGRVVRFFPRLPTHLRDENGDFYTEGSARDNAVENAGLKPATNYQMLLFGRGHPSPIRSRSRNRPLRQSVYTNFSTAPATDPADLYTERTYSDTPPPQYSFSNPPDSYPSVRDQYTYVGGTAGVPSDVAASLFCTRVPISPTTLRVLGNVTLTLVERQGDPSLRRPIDGSVFVEQNFSTTLMVFRPKFPLQDEATYALRVKKDVKDLTEQYDFAPNRVRERLRSIYDWLAGARNFQISQGNPNPTGADLPNPPAELIADWPSDAATRNLLKENILKVGDERPDEFDSRVMLVFTTRNEPVSQGKLRVEFEKAENLFDAAISTGEYDSDTVPSAASAILTIAGGSAANGDFKPTSNVTLSVGDFNGGVMNFRDVVIPAGVNVRIVGDRPVQMRAINFNLDGTIDIRGFDGQTGRTTAQNNPVEAIGGDGGPGGGDGGNANPDYSRVSAANVQKGLPGERGTDDEGTVDSPVGGSGGLGGGRSTGTYYSYAGGGGGGGARLPGGNGQAGTGYYPSWNGAGGQGGAGSQNELLNPLVGGAGGAAGGAGGAAAQSSTSYTWHKSGSAGGGGGGAINIQVARVLTIGSDGRIMAIGGQGGDIVMGSYGSGGPGGGGGGGSVLLRSGTGFNIADPARAVNVSGGQGGQGNSYTYTTNDGGDGGDGYIRLEDPNGGQTISGATAGTFDPVGGGVPSFVYTKFADLGVPGTRIVNPTNDDVATEPTANDAIFVEIQATRENPDVFGEPDLTAINGQQDSIDTSITSDWMPLKVHDLTGKPGGNFQIPGYSPGANGLEYTFPIDALNGRNFRFIRYRITFQLDDDQSRTDPIPFVDFIELLFQFNF